VELRLAGPGDTAAVLEVQRQAFEDDGEAVAALVAALLRDDPEALSVVAEDAGEVVGHVLISRSLLDAPRRLVDVGVLSPLGVRPDRQGRGIGAALVRRALELADQRWVPVVFLEGSPRYYPRLGFRPGAELGFRKPSLRIPDAAFQAVPLAAYEPWMTGTLVYASAFWELDLVGLRDPAEQ
jgi:putative acetyltransferase